jgi:hypothetical protein
MDVALSRRAAAALGGYSMTNELSFAERQQFVTAVEQSSDFDSLPANYQQMILDFEQKAQVQDAGEENSLDSQPGGVVGTYEEQ